MRTTVTLEPEVARLLNDQARRTHKSFKETLNTAVRCGLGGMAESPENQQFALDARPRQLKAGVDSGRFNALLDDLEADVFISQASAGRRKPTCQ